MRFLGKMLIGLVFFLLPTSIAEAQSSNVTPSYNCLATDCPGMHPSISPVVTIPVKAPLDINKQPCEPFSAESSPSVSPDQSGVHKTGTHHHKGGFLKDFYQMFMALIEIFLKISGYGSLNAPCAKPAATPSPIVVPSPTISLASKVQSPSTAASCVAPSWSSSDANGMQEINGFFVHNNMWNASNYPDTKQTIFACAPNNWYVTATANDSKNDGAVKTYPNAHKDYNDAPLSSLPNITSTYVHIAPTFGNWNVAYDIWLNGIASSGSTEVMIWTQAMGKQAEAVKSYPRIGTVTLSGITYNVYKDNRYIVFEMTPYKVSGTVNLTELFTYLTKNGHIPANSTLGQIGYGVEIVSTDNKPGTFKFTKFSLTTN